MAGLNRTRHVNLGEAAAGAGSARPSRLYSGTLWRRAVGVARLLPPPCLDWLGTRLASAYSHWAPNRLETVRRNLEPVVGAAASRAAARELFWNFGLKLSDLWRLEAGLPVGDKLAAGVGASEFRRAVSSGKGALLLTAHIGNWEFGAPLLAQMGARLLVVTQAEPGADLTRMRLESRRRAGVETLVIGEDPFAFVELMRRLDKGEIVALLVDRPPHPASVKVELFGRPFAASTAPADLARATGCVLLPVVLPRVGGRYEARALEPIAYDRRGIHSREARAGFTQEIMAAFEPMIREFATQWYHFVPLWNELSVGTRGGKGLSAQASIGEAAPL